jgi:zinc transporter 2
MLNIKMDIQDNAYSKITKNELDLGVFTARKSYREASIKMLCTSLLGVVFLLLEFIGGYISNSLAIMTDVAHLFSDCAGFLVSFIALYQSNSTHYSLMTYGYHRIEAIGGFVSVTIIYGFAAWLVVEGVRKIRNPTHINSIAMLITSVLGMLCNIIVVNQTHGHYMPKSNISNIHKFALSHINSKHKKNDDDDLLGTANIRIS